MVYGFGEAKLGETQRQRQGKQETCKHSGNLSVRGVEAGFYAKRRDACQQWIKWSDLPLVVTQRQILHCGANGRFCAALLDYARGKKAKLLLKFAYFGEQI